MNNVYVKKPITPQLVKWAEATVTGLEPARMSPIDLLLLKRFKSIALTTRPHCPKKVSFYCE